MKRFSDYIKEREDLEFGPGGEPQVHPSSDGAGEALNLAMQKYPAKVHKFLKELAQKDPDIKRALGDNVDDGYPKDPHDSDDNNTHEIVPPAADGSSGDGEME